jgi:hypothetical protein
VEGAISQLMEDNALDHCQTCLAWAGKPIDWHAILKSWGQKNGLPALSFLDA